MKSINDLRTITTVDATAANASDNTVLYTSGDVSWANVHVFEGVTNTGDVFVSLDGINFTTNPIYLEDLYTATPATRVVSVAANKVAILRGKFKKIKVQNAGAAAARVRILHGAE